MAQLTMTDQEVRTLRRALEMYVSDLRMEIADTDSMDFREKLKEEERVLKDVLERLAATG